MIQDRKRNRLCSSNPVDSKKPEARLDSCFEIRPDAGTGARSATRLMAGQLAVDAGRMADRNAKPRASGSSCDAARVCRSWAGVARGMRRSSQFFQTPRLGPVKASRHPSSTSRPPIRRVRSDAEFLTPNPSPGRSGDTPDTGPFDCKACSPVDEGLVPRGLALTSPFPTLPRSTTTTANMSQTIGAVSSIPNGPLPRPQFTR